MIIQTRYLPYFSSFNIALAIGLSFAPFSAKAFLITLFFITIIQIRNYKLFQKSFSDLHQWQEVDKELLQEKSIAGILFSDNSYKESQKNQLDRLKGYGKSLNYVMNFILCGVAITTVLKFNPATTKTQLIGILLLLIIQPATVEWTLTVTRHLALIVFAAVCFKFNHYSNYLVFVLFVFVFFFLLNAYLQYFYQQLCQRKNIQTLRLIIPIKTIGIFLTLFFFTSILIPEQNSLINFKKSFQQNMVYQNDSKKLQVTLNKKLLEKMNLNKIPQKTLEQVLKNLPANNKNTADLEKLIQEQQSLNELNNQIPDVLSEKEMKNLDNLKNLDQISQKTLEERINNWNELNDRTWEQINNGDLPLTPEGQEHIREQIREQIKDHPNFQPKSDLKLEINENNPPKQDVFKRKASLDHQIKKKKIEERIKELREEVKQLKQKEEKNQLINKILRYMTHIAIALIIIFVLNVLLSFFKRDEISFDEELDQLRQDQNEKIKTLLQNIPANFKTDEQEVISCYEFFHHTINQLFYDNLNQQYSPPPSLLKSPESMLSVRLKKISIELSNLYIPFKYDAAFKLNKHELKNFRSNFKDFIRLASKIAKA